MKSLSVRLGVIVVIGLAIFGNAEVWGADWKFYGSTEMYLGYYDAQGITRPSKNIIRVWGKDIFMKEGVSKLVRKSGKGYENFSHSISLSEINCVEKTFRQLKVTFYDNEGGSIGTSNSPSEWIFFTPESMGEKLYKEVCK
ncbi:MAG: surface-adhesin E family protein [Thermodesulfobacteriota bacterium]